MVMDEKQTDPGDRFPSPPWRRYPPMHHSQRLYSRSPRLLSRGIFLFIWFVVIFGLMGVLVIGGLGFVAYLIRAEDPMMMHSHTSGRLLVPALCLIVPLVFMILAGWSRRRISNPLAGILEAAEAITAGDLSARIPENARGPFRTVERAFNRMIAELERSDQQRRDLTADIAHDLNTPIHIIRGYLEGIADGIYQPDEETINLLLDETNLLSRLVEDLRTLTLADSGELPLHPEEIDLADHPFGGRPGRADPVRRPRPVGPDDGKPGGQRAAQHALGREDHAAGCRYRRRD
jgi:signal transduction histidine kinase